MATSDDDDNTTRRRERERVHKGERNNALLICVKNRLEKESGVGVRLGFGDFVKDALAPKFFGRKLVPSFSSPLVFN